MDSAVCYFCRSLFHAFVALLSVSCSLQHEEHGYTKLIQLLVEDAKPNPRCFTYVVDENTRPQLVRLFHKSVLYPSVVIDLQLGNSTPDYQHCPFYFVFSPINSSLLDIRNPFKDLYASSRTFVFVNPSSPFPPQLGSLLNETKSTFLILDLNSTSPLIRIRRVSLEKSLIKLRTINLWNGTHLVYANRPLFPTPVAVRAKKHIRICTFQQPPHILESKGSFSGIEVSLVRAYAETLGVTPVFYLPPNNEKWGDEINGTWSGMFGQVQQGLADIGIANIFLTLPRYNTFDMSYPYDIDNANFAVRLPEPHPQWQALLTPFSPTLWLFTGIAFVVSGLCIPLLSEWYHYMLPSLAPGPFYRCFSESYFYMVQVFTGITANESPNPITIKTFLFILWAVFFFVTSGFRASLTASLSVPPAPLPIDTNSQLLDSGLALGCVGLEMKSLFMSLEDPIVRQIGMRYTPVDSVDEGIQRAAEGSYAFMENRVYLVFAASTSHLDCYGTPTLHLLKEGIMSFPISLALPKRSPYKPRLDQVILRLRQNGLLHYWQEEAIRHARTSALQLSVANCQTDPLILSLYDLEGAFLLLIIGYIPCTLAFLAERLRVTGR